MEEKSQKLYAKVEKYGGWKQVPAEAVHSIFEEIVNPTRLGFVKAKRGYLARRIDDDITHVLKLDHLKGSACGIAYGASLSYLPYPYVPSVRWHRTLRSASVDLCEQPQVDWLDLNAGSYSAESHIATTMLGEKCFREELAQHGKKRLPGFLRGSTPPSRRKEF